MSIFVIARYVMSPHPTLIIVVERKCPTVGIPGVRTSELANLLYSARMEGGSDEKAGESLQCRLADRGHSSFLSGLPYGQGLVHG